MSVLEEQKITKILQMKEFLIGQGIPFEEAERAAIAYYESPEPPYAQQWPGDVTGLDLMPQIDPLQVPDTGSPPYFQPNAEQTDFIPGVGVDGYMSLPTPDPLGAVKTHDPLYDLEGSNIGHTYKVINPPYEGDDTNWVATGNNLESQPPTIGTEGVVPTQPWKYPVEQSQMTPDIPPIAIYPSGQLNETESDLMQYVYQSHDNDDVCNQFSGKTYEMSDRSHRPVPPSEGLGYTNTHPNCKCYWKPTGEIKADKILPTGLLDIQTIHRKIGQRSHAGTLHKVKKDGELSQKPGKRNYYRKPLKMMQEALAEVRHEFGWLTEDYLQRANGMAIENGGRLYLIRASQESITDHRAEGEPYRRLLAATELSSMARTATGHGMDINHNPDWRTGATILDSEFDPNSKSIQMVIMETDDQINTMIDNGQITAVSINGGSPRAETVEPCQAGCSDGSCELCVVPKGVILGELDDIGLTWVVTDPRGIMWNGVHIPKAEPGVKTTIIQPI